jgi:uncharacterized membrane protein YhiD involved in acid resistance
VLRSAGIKSAEQQKKQQHTLNGNETWGEFLQYADIYGARFLASLVAGGIVGAERQLYEKPAGLRTCIIVTISCCLFTIVSIASGTAMGGDPLRITAQIVSGIGFIGGGVILHYKNHVKGITTAATIFMCAAIGVTCGSGYVFSGVALSIIVLLVLFLLKPVDRLIDTHPMASKLRTIDRTMFRKLRKRKEFIDTIIQVREEKEDERSVNRKRRPEGPGS